MSDVIWIFGSSLSSISRTLRSTLSIRLSTQLTRISLLASGVRPLRSSINKLIPTISSDSFLASDEGIATVVLRRKFVTVEDETHGRKKKVETRKNALDTLDLI